MNTMDERIVSHDPQNPELCRSGFRVSVPQLAAHFAISLAIPHSLLAQLSLMKASLPQFRAASALVVVEAVMAVVRRYPDAPRSKFDLR